MQSPCAIVKPSWSWSSFMPASQPVCVPPPGPAMNCADDPPLLLFPPVLGPAPAPPVPGRPPPWASLAPVPPVLFPGVQAARTTASAAIERNEEGELLIVAPCGARVRDRS
ncbi:MAG: hypothetical protein IPM79_37215 [Polyangiaceae bacterium]|nr:hypothetical protein [Polyangiaceae bacterium]